MYEKFGVLWENVLIKSLTRSIIRDVQLLSYLVVQTESYQKYRKYLITVLADLPNW